MFQVCVQGHSVIPSRGSERCQPRIKNKAYSTALRTASASIPLLNQRINEATTRPSGPEKNPLNTESVFYPLYPKEKT